jgi:predicted RND superfamily exporter protein
MHSDTHEQTASAASFDPRSGSLVERAIFNGRAWVVLLCVALTVLLCISAKNLRLNANFEGMLPSAHPYIQNYLSNRDELRASGNSVRIVVESGHSIFDPLYLARLQKISDEVFLLPGVDRPHMKSLWTSNTRWVAVTADGLEGGRVIPDDYDGSTGSVDAVRANVMRSGEIGQLVASDFRSTSITVPLLSLDPETRKPLDYHQLSQRLEDIRQRYEIADAPIHIVGLAKVLGDLIDALSGTLTYFAIAIVLSAILLYWYTRCIRSTAVVVSCSLVAVTWQLGLLPLFGFELDPYSVLVPFLVFAIGMSHGAQKMNGIIQDVGRGMDRLVAARFTFRRLFLAGLTALLCDAVGFGVLSIIRIDAIRQLAWVASLGVAVLVLTNLILLPVLLSYIGVGVNAARRSVAAVERHDDGVSLLARMAQVVTSPRGAVAILAAAAILAIAGLTTARSVKVGDLDPGAPELRVDSRYNADNRYVVAHYGASSDAFVVMVKTPDGQCADYDTLMRVDQLEWQLRQMPEIVSTASLASLSRRMLLGLNEGNGKWYELLPNQGMLNSVLMQVPREYFNQSCNLLPVTAYLRDHKADSLDNVARQVQAFVNDNQTPRATFLLAAGNSGIDAATNAVVKTANQQMVYLVYGAVVILCLVTFRSWRAVLCAVLPLMLTSVLCEALMVLLDIGLKVSTLPVVALGVGIGVDYALYVMSVMLQEMRRGASLKRAYAKAMQFTGKVVLLTGFTLASGVATWWLSPIKFQADMGALLAFMFLWNMVGALVLLPALAHFLLRVPRATSATLPRESLTEFDTAR